MRVAFISQWYDPERGSAALPGVIARALRDEGHDVHVVTGFPNYPDGKVYPGYKVRPYSFERLDGVNVHRTALWVNHDTNAVRRAGNYLTFAAGAVRVALAKLPEVDAAWVHGTPATAAIPALALKRFKGTPFVLHVQDLWPDTVTASGFLSNHQARRLQAMLHRMCDHIYTHSAAIAVTAPGMIDSIRARGVPSDKVTFLPNWADESAFYPYADATGAKAELGLGDSFVVMYAGNFGEFQALDTLIRAAEHLRERRDITFALVGGGVEEEKLRGLVQAAELDNVVFIPPQPFNKMADILAAGDVQLISLRDRPLSRLTLPSKLQATLSAGRPIIGALTGDAAHVVAESQAGVTVVPGDSSDLARAISELAEQGREGGRIRGEAARRYYETHFQQKLGLARMTTLLERAAEGRTA